MSPSRTKITPRPALLVGRQGAVPHGAEQQPAHSNAVAPQRSLGGALTPGSFTAGHGGAAPSEVDTAPQVPAPRCVSPAATEAAAHDPLPKDRFSERELSWLAFNERVLELAEDEAVPLLERVRYLAIFASNLDEFYMVRVAGLQRRIATGMARATVAGFEPSEILSAIHARTAELADRHSRCFGELLRPQLESHGIHFVQWSDLDGDSTAAAAAYFRSQVYPIITPMAVDPSHPFPYISGRSRNLAVVLRHPGSDALHFARIKVPASLPRFFSLRGVPSLQSHARRNIAFLPIEDVIAQHLPELFPGMEVVEHHSFRVTRNADLEVEEDDAENLLSALEQELVQRRFRPAVRLEIEPTMPPNVADFLAVELQVSAGDVFRVPGPLDLTGLNQVADVEASDLHFEPFLPATTRFISAAESASPAEFFNTLRNRDVLVHHPYDSFSTSVQEFLRQAASDPDVVAIKQTLYRTSGDSPIVDALIDAAAAGKQVLALVELKARFDEQANITWARKLESNGVHVVYGMVGLKTHAKLCLVVRQEALGLQRYCHVGTGNYNPKTARLYEDVGLLTSDPEIVEDVAKLFNQLSGYAPGTTFKQLLVAPDSLRSGLKERIDSEAERARRGETAWVKIKVNSLVDEALIDALYRASQAGVRIDVIVRGICALRPGVPGLSDTIQVRSILGRFLEHSRIFAFGAGGENEVWIGSADLMHRNLDRRVEAVVRLRDPAHVKEQLRLLSLAAAPHTASWHLASDGTWTRHHQDANGAALCDLQQCMIDSRARKVHT